MKSLVGSKVLVRSAEAGVFFGVLAAQDGNAVQLEHSRRIWYWAGAKTLSQLATAGPSRPAECKIPAALTVTHEVRGVCEIIPCTEAGAAALEAVPAWS